MEDAGPGRPRWSILDMMRCSVLWVARCFTSKAASLLANCGSSISRPPSTRSDMAIVRNFSIAVARVVAYAAPPRSNSRRYLATVQPSFSSPTRFRVGTRTSSKNTWLTSWSPAMVMIGSTEIPVVFMSIRMKVMPSCCLPSVEVRTRQNMRLACCAPVVQILVPLTT